MGASRTVKKVESKLVVCMLVRHTYNITKGASQWFGQFEQKRVKVVKHIITNTVFRSVLLL